MKAHCLRLLALVPFAALGACEDTGRSGPGVEIAVAPLTLPGALDVSYGLTVFNDIGRGDGNIVWTENPVTSGQYGNGPGGSITYIGTCDADTPNQGDNINYVELVLNTITVPNGAGSLPPGTLNTLDDQNTTLGIYGGDGDPDFQNPCRPEDPCVLSFECIENADVLVQFNITVMRGAEQGFFDIAVNFEDVFCSAKFDSCYDVTTTVDQNAPVKREKGGETYYRYSSTLGGPFFKDQPIWAVERLGIWSLYLDDNGNIGGIQDRVTVTETGTGILDTLTAVRVIQEITETEILTLQRGVAYTQSGGRPITLLYGPNEGDPRQHTGIAALACTHGADSTGAAADNNETQILLTQPTVVCRDGEDQKVTFLIDIGNAEEGNGSVEDEDGNYELGYGLYFGEELLDCGQGPGSCNKVYYNIALNLAQLEDQGLVDCKLGYGATAISGANTDTFNDNGELIDPSAQYGAIGFGSKSNPIALTDDSGTPACSAFPLGAPGSPVQPGYIKGIGYGDQYEGFAFDFYTNGTAAKSFPRVNP